MTKGLLPGFVTVLCAPKGSSKSFLIMQAARFWWEQKYNPAVLMMEEDQEFHLCRSLAQETGNSELTDPDWVKANQAAIAKIKTEYRDFLNTFGKCIYGPPEDMSSKAVLQWMEARASEGSRIIVVDPITARSPSRTPWADDHEFIMGAKAIATAHKISLVFVTHPTKGYAKNQSLGIWGDDDISGGKEIQNFAQNIFWLEYMASAECEAVLTSAGTIDQWINRKLQIRKTRSKDGQGRVIGFFFNGGTLKFEERGVLGQA